MAATGNEFVLLRQLKLATDYITGAISELKTDKLDAPASAGTDGQMLVYGSAGNQWINVPEGTAYSADNATLQLTGTQFSVKDKGITAAKIADGVIPDTSGFITQTAADAAYQPKGDYLTEVPAEYLTQTEADAAYAAKSHTHANATAAADGFMSSEDKTKLDGLSNYTLPEATATTLGGVKVATDEDAKAFLGY